MARRTDSDVIESNHNDGMANDQVVTKKVSKQEQNRLDILSKLAELGGLTVSTESITSEGRRFVVPETMTLQEASAFLDDYIEAQETETDFVRNYNYKPWDVAHALQSAMRKNFGSAGIQQATWSFFGKEPPQQITIPIAYGESTNVPWGNIAVPIFKGVLTLGGDNHREKGILGRITINAAKKYQAQVEGLFTIVEEELRTNSIYRGKAIDGQQMPDFIDLSTVDPAKIIYATDVQEQLEANVWSLLRHTDVMRKLKVPLKRAVLLDGPYGTGKTVAAFLTAQIAVENGWSFVYCRPGRDELEDVMQTARLYQPAVVFFEDVDTISSTHEGDSVTRLLDLFDGINAKGTELMAIMTTNHVERIHKGMVRPGRLDAVIHIDALDANGIERMIKSVVPTSILNEDVDYALVAISMEGYLPAFVKESIDRAMRYAIARTGAAPDDLTTEDFVRAGEGLRHQLELMNAANEGKTRPEFEELLKAVVSTSVDGITLQDIDGDKAFEVIVEKPENSDWAAHR